MRVPLKNIVLTDNNSNKNIINNNHDYQVNIDKHHDHHHYI